MNTKQISLLAAFTAARVEFVVVGGLAVIFYGYERVTRDMDIFIRPTEENARTAFRALQQMGVPLDGLEPADLLADYENVRLGPESDHIDVLPSIGEMSFEQVWSNRVEAEVGGVVVPFISKKDLIANKQQVGRLRDLADVEELEQIPDVEEH